MKSHRVAVLAGALAVLCGCTGDAEPPGEVPEEGAEAVRPELPGDSPAARCATMRARGLLVEADSRSELRSELGEPEAQTHRTEPNRHVPGRTDTIWTVRHGTLEARIRTAGGRDLTERIVVMDASALRFREPTIGTPVDRLVSLLGEPDERGAEEVRYLCASEPTADMPLVFELEEGRVEGIVWEYYVD